MFFNRRCGVILKLVILNLKLDQLTNAFTYIFVRTDNKHLGRWSGQVDLIA